ERPVHGRRHGAVRGHSRQAQWAVADPEAPDHPVVADSRGPAQLVGDLAKAHIAARCPHRGAELGVAHAIDDQPRGSSEIGARTGLNSDAIGRILRLLAAHGVFEAGPAGYSHNAASRLLRSGHPESLRPYVRMNALPAFWARYGDLATAARTGRP